MSIDLKNYDPKHEVRAANLIKTLQNTKGTGSAKAKTELLKSVQSDKEFEQFFTTLLTMILDSRIVLNQADVDPSLVRGLALKSIKRMSLFDAFREAIESAQRGDVGAKNLAKLYHAVQPEAQMLFKLFVLREIKAGYGIKSINKIWPDLVYYSPYMRCGSISKKHYEKWDWDLGVFSQLKSDGMFDNLHVTISANEDSKMPSMEFQWVSRQGRELVSQSLANIASQIAAGMTFVHDIDIDWTGHIAQTFHGELLVYTNEGQLMEREAGNGLINQLIEEGKELPEGYVVKYRIWDTLPTEDFFKLEYKVEYRHRWAEVVKVVEAYLENNEPEIQAGAPVLFEQCENRIVHTPEEMFAHFKELLERGEEGSVVKNPKGFFKDGTSNDQLKVKLVMDVELKVVGYNDGDKNGKHADTLGSIQFESEDGLIVSGVAGMTDDFREAVHNNREYYMGKIFTIRCNGVQKNPDEDKPDTLYFPRIVSEPRLDKSVADTYTEILQQQQDVIAAGGKI
ncbi:hypothetical protein [Vibrio phage BX-1]|nr:hypothetical protein [Vibrio phage BX-1]